MLVIVAPPGARQDGHRGPPRPGVGRPARRRAGVADPGRHARRSGLLPGRPGQPARGRPGSRRPALDACPGFADRAAIDGRAAGRRQRRRGRRSPAMSPGRVSSGSRSTSARLGPERAFADGLALPLRRLSEKSGFRPPVLLVDSLDEAYASAVAQNLPRLLADLDGARLVLTTRDDPRVLASIGLDAAVAAGEAVRIHLVEDAPADIDDVAAYAARAPARSRTGRGRGGPRRSDRRGRQGQLPVRVPRRRRAARVVRARPASTRPRRRTFRSPRAVWRASTATSSVASSAVTEERWSARGPADPGTARGRSR